MSRPTTHDIDPAESVEETEQVEEKATDVEADASPEEVSEEAPTENAEPEKAPSAEEYAALKARLEEAEKALASRALDEARTKAVTDAGLASKYAHLLGDDQDSWQAKVELLNALRESGDESTSVPRDPAVDASPDIEETETMEFARALLGV